MGYYIVKRNQEVVGEALIDFYFYGNVVNEGTEQESFWGTNQSYKKIFDTEEEAEMIFSDSALCPPNFRGATVEIE